jgi:hypothetical protein
MFPTFRHYWESRKPVLDEAFRREIADLLGEAPLRNAAPFLAALDSGKKIRGCLCCLIAESLGGTLESAIPRALAVELIQAATLIHDDFVDQDTTRRNLPASWTLEGARRAVLIGDVIFASAIKMMSDLGREDGGVVAHAIAQVSRGALHEPLDPVALSHTLESGKWKSGLYEKIIRLKTGILFGAACQLGAIAANARRRIQEISFRYGVRIGDAYQIADDLTDVRACLGKDSIPPEQMASLAPALLFFADDIRPLLVPFLRAGGAAGKDGVWEALRSSRTSMEEEINRRLQAARKEIDGEFPSNPACDLARRAPWDLIEMFHVHAERK